MTKDEALKALIHEMEYVLSCINKGKIPFDGDDFHEALRLGKKALAQPEPMRLRRGDILRSIETDELCTVWSTSTTGKTLIKWGANDFCGYTAEQIGELFWLEPSPDDLELSAEKSDNYTTPPQRIWVGLTKTEVVDLLCEYSKLTGNVGWQQLIYMTEAKLKQKNGYAEENT